MKTPPANLKIGHAIAYILLYVAKYNDGESNANEFHEILKSTQYWMGPDTSAGEIRNLLIETDEWFSSGSNFERTDMLEKVIAMILKNSGQNKTIIKEIFEDSIRVCASNDAKYQSTMKNDVTQDEALLNELFEEYPLLMKLQEKFGYS